MRKTVELATVFALLAGMTLVGCTEQLPTMPSEDGATSFFTRAPATGFGVMRRQVPLPHDISVSQVIGPEGGRLDIAEAGISFVIPPNALDEATSITMTALSGDATAVEFAPRGLRFDVPATMHVRPDRAETEELLLRRPNGSPLDSFLGVYFEGDPQLGVEPLENIRTFVLDGAIVFEVGHFSGYATASG